MDSLNYYNSYTKEEKNEEREIICLLLDRTQFKAGIKRYSHITSSHVGEKNASRLLLNIFPLLQSENAFILPDGSFLSPQEAIEMVDSVLYLEILHEEMIKQSGRRSFFISSFKSVSLTWVFLAIELILYKGQEKSPKDLLAMAIGLKSYNLQVASKWSLTERVKSYVFLTRPHRIGAFEDGAFIGYTNNRKINSIEEIQQMIFEEITKLVNYFEKNCGEYFESYGRLAGIKTLPVYPKQAEPPRKERVIGPLEKNLAVLKLKEVPASKSELKKIFFRLAVATHPDKFAHQNNGTRTEIAIVDKFREIHNAYEFIEMELDKISRK